ncbi:hypothetical protein PR048_002161 [Dryococelus australis]|uniref:Uncharacterized protein n=1 Tax=Dryococelus australis TaxID=614101 RepID=A0ABQ9IKX6_9NEOP|nr:hypothetical protein PR048_002161 [Dryococelus australis]
MASVNGYVTPHWLDEKFIIDILTEYNKEPSEDSLIIETIPQNEDIKKLLTVNFLLESEMLRNVIPAMHKLLGDSVKLGAKCVFFCRDPEPRLVMEDHCHSGFTLAKRRQGLDLDHSRMAISCIGVLRAASTNSPTIKIFYSNSIENLAAEMTTWPELGPKFSEKLLCMKQTLFDRLMKSVEGDEEGLRIRPPSWLRSQPRLATGGHVGQSSEASTIMAGVTARDSIRRPCWSEITAIYHLGWLHSQGSQPVTMFISPSVTQPPLLL